MHAMMRSSRRGLILGMVAVSALLVVAGIAYATTGGDSTAKAGNATDARDDGVAYDQPLQATPTSPQPGGSAPAPSTNPPDHGGAVVTDPAPGTAKPADQPGSGAGVSGQVPGTPPDAPTNGRAPMPAEPTDPGGTTSIANPDAKDGNVASPPLPGTEAPMPTTPPIGASNLPKSDLPPLPANTQRVDAPIDGLDIPVMESFPPQYLLQIQAGLPSGCAQKAGFEAARDGNTIKVKVYNSMPKGAVACTMIYGMYDLNLNLGSDFVSGQTYTVVVNDKTTTFTAQ